MASAHSRILSSSRCAAAHHRCQRTHQFLNLLDHVGTAEIESARARLRGVIARTPTVRCAAAPDDRAVHLKLENLQPAGSFKLRPIGNALLSRPRSALSAGVHTFSSGNSALALAWMAKRMGIAATAVVPEGAAESKLALIRVARCTHRPSAVRGMVERGHVRSLFAIRHGVHRRRPRSRRHSPEVARLRPKFSKTCRTSRRSSCRSAAAAWPAGSPTPCVPRGAP